MFVVKQIICFRLRFDFSADLRRKLQTPAQVVSVFDSVQMQGERGAVATVGLPAGNSVSCEVSKYSALVFSCC